MKQALKKHAAKLRFVLVGGVNTAIDFGVLFGLTACFGLPKEFANFISTTTAFVFSFFANKKFTFKSTTKNLRQQFIRFAAVTLFGLWVIQNIIIFASTPLFVELGLSQRLALLAAKIIATIASLIWNYILYSKVVFKK